MTSIRPCNCKNEGQDELHGKGRRVKNSTASDSWRCTVCGQNESAQITKRKK